MQIYEPREDSYLLAEQVTKHANGNVLDVGTGSGLQAIIASRNKNVASVTAVDINKNCQENIVAANRKIKFIQSDLFSKIPRQKFDTIIFNPPYLPQDKGIEDSTIYGGKKGYEVIERFLSNCNSHLTKNGIILLLFSNLTNKTKVDKIISDSCLDSIELVRKALELTEILYVYKITKSLLLRKFEDLRISQIKRLAAGNRGIIYTGFLKKIKVAIKAKKPGIPGVNTVSNETKWLKILNKHDIGPKLIVYTQDFFVYRFVEGKYLVEFIHCNKKGEIMKVILDIMQQCRLLDKLRVNKEEMLRPYKHVIITKKPVLIDFERCRQTLNPKNITQFCQFLVNGYVQQLLAVKNITINKQKILSAAKTYKKEQSGANFIRICKLIT